MRAWSWIAAFSLAAAGVEAQRLPGPTPARWTVTVTTTGGIAGTGKGTLLAQSDGSVSCTAPMTCPARLSPDTLERIAAALAAVRTPASPRPVAPSFCRDCYVITIRLARQSTPDHPAGEAVFTWTEPAGAAVAADVRAVYAAVQALDEPAR